MENIGTIILATGALGTAAFGIVEGFKWTRLGLAGVGAITKALGPLMKALAVAYGRSSDALLKAQYRGDQRELTRVIRQGVRIGLTPENASEIGEFVGVVDTGKLREAAAQVKAGTDLSAELRNVLGRFELAVDARIDAALTLAQNHYAATLRGVAAIVALLIALVVGAYLSKDNPKYLFHAILVGIAAVPLAPIAKDLVTALQSASKAIRTKP